MKKVFLYLYPIKEYADVFILDNEYYDSNGEKRPFDIMNECIEKRYRNNGYEVVWVLYPDKEIYGLVLKESDRVIYSDVSFTEATGYDKNGNKKDKDKIKYPNEELLINQLGDIEKLVVGGYHAMDCVKRVAETSLKHGIDTIIDMDLTDMFNSIYWHQDYFDVEKEYNPEDYMEFRMKQLENNTYKEDWPEWEETERNEFLETYSSAAYGFTKTHSKKNI